MPEPDWMLLLSAARLAVGIEYVTSFLRCRAARRGGCGQSGGEASTWRIKGPQGIRGRGAHARTR